MCHSCGSRNLDRSVPPAWVFLLGKRELWDTGYFLDSRLRGNDTFRPGLLSACLSRRARGRLL